MVCSWIILNLILRLTHPLQSSVTFISDVWLFRDLWWRILSLPRNKVTGRDSGIFSPA